MATTLLGVSVLVTVRPAYLCLDCGVHLWYGYGCVCVYVHAYVYTKTDLDSCLDLAIIVQGLSSQVTAGVCLSQSSRCH